MKASIRLAAVMAVAVGGTLMMTVGAASASAATVCAKVVNPATEGSWKTNNKGTCESKEAGGPYAKVETAGATSLGGGIWCMKVVAGEPSAWESGCTTKGTGWVKVNLGAGALFEAESYPTTGVGLRTPTAEPSKNNGFEIAGATSDCGEASFKSTVGYTGPVSAVAVTPTYKECWTQIGSLVYLTEVNTKSCQYEFTAGEKGSEPAGHYVKGTVSVVDCPSTSPIVVTVRDTTKWEEKSEISILCTVEVSESGNKGLKEVKYENFGSGSGREVKVEADVTGISFITKGCPAGVATSGSNGVYQAATAVTAKTKPATVKLTSPSEPVTANVQGYEFGKTKKIGVFVEEV